MTDVVAGPPAPAPGLAGFEWTEWHLEPSVVTGLLLLAGVYLAACRWRRRIDPDARVEPVQAASFMGALLVMFGALTGPMHELSDHYLFSAHMIQHMLLVFAMPPLLLYGTPGFMVRSLVRDPRLIMLGRLLTRPSGAFAVFNLVLVGWHLPPLYNLAMDHHPFHIVEHLMMMAAAVILWWPVLSPLAELPRAPYPVQMLYLFLVGLPVVMVAIFIAMSDSVLYPYYARAPRVWAPLTPYVDQHLGGLIMWIPGGIVFMVAISVVFFRWQAAGGLDGAIPMAEARHAR